MRSELKPDQRALAEYMSELSERAFCAGWMENLEHALWRAVVEGPYRYGRLELTSQQVETLRKLSTGCGGWVRFDAATEETFVALEEWKRKYDVDLALQNGST